MSAAIFDSLSEAIIIFDEVKAKEIAEKGIREGVSPVEMIEHGIRAGLDIMGERFASGAIFLPELMLAAKAADAAVGVLEPEFEKSGSIRKNEGKILLATVKGDLHDIGKNILALLLKAAGFEVIDIGVDKSGDDILKTAQTHQVDVIGLSALLTTTMSQLKDFIDLLKESGHREQYKVIIGGAPVTQEFADTIGADGYGADAADGVRVMKKTLSA